MRFPRRMRRQLMFNLLGAALSAVTLVFGLVWKNAHGLGALLRTDPEGLAIAAALVTPAFGLFAVLAFAITITQEDRT